MDVGDCIEFSNNGKICKAMILQIEGKKITVFTQSQAQDCYVKMDIKAKDIIGGAN